MTAMAERLQRKFDVRTGCRQGSTASAFGNVQRRLLEASTGPRVDRPGDSHH